MSKEDKRSEFNNAHNGSVNSPCYHCQRRTIGCECDDYHKFREKIKELREIEYQESVMKDNRTRHYKEIGDRKEVKR